jgi:geranylgeranyl diphosphate synthase type I
MLGDVVMGQVIDVAGAASSRDEVDAMHRRKTAAYTTTGPLAMGAILAGADARTTEALREVGAPLGVAFQLTDDLLGTFGDPARTGKPSRGDLRKGKKTALVAELEEDRDAQRLLPRVLGVEDAPDEEVDALIARMVSSGAKARVETRIASLMQHARARIDGLTLTQEGKALLLGAMDLLTGRQV